ncbi:MAG: ion channel [Planctomycetota bacterium]
MDNTRQGNGGKPQDLGFGSVVGAESRRRLLNRDGSFNVEREGQVVARLKNLYQCLITMTWPRFVGSVAALYLAINALFAAAYLACGQGAVTGVETFGDAFFFTVQTLSTVGYGAFAPATTTAHLLMTLESLVGLFVIALVTGLSFARFSRPRADILFSDRAIIAPYRGGTAFEFRLANLRRSELINVGARVIFTWMTEKDGVRKREYERLNLERDDVSFFPLTWTVVHPIDKDSPLHGMDEQALRVADAEFLVLLHGTDDVFSQTVHTRSSYKASEVQWQVRFADVFHHPTGDERVSVDLDRLHATVAA